MLRMQLAKSMRLREAKAYVARILGVTTVELGDCSVMREIREELDIGYPMPPDGAAKGIEAKFRIAALLGVKINAVERFKAKAGLPAGMGSGVKMLNKQEGIV